MAHCLTSALLYLGKVHSGKLLRQINDVNDPSVDSVCCAFVMEKSGRSVLDRNVHQTNFV